MTATQNPTPAHRARAEAIEAEAVRLQREAAHVHASAVDCAKRLRAAERAAEAVGVEFASIVFRLFFDDAGLARALKLTQEAAAEAYGMERTRLGDYLRLGMARAMCSAHGIEGHAPTVTDAAALLAAGIRKANGKGASLRDLPLQADYIERLRAFATDASPLVPETAVARAVCERIGSKPAEALTGEGPDAPAVRAWAAFVKACQRIEDPALRSKLAAFVKGDGVTLGKRFWSAVEASRVSAAEGVEA
jgi:hypothetical protein